MKKFYIAGAVLIVVIVIVFVWWRGEGSESPFLPTTTSSAQTVSTVPANGDGNPYGIAFVPKDFPTGGVLNSGDILISNWNNSKNIQGKGTTIVRVTSDGKQTLFFQGPSPLGLTTALAVLKSGFVIVGNLPTTDGTGATAKAGFLLVIDSAGRLVTTLADKNLIQGPWDIAVHDKGSRAQVFLSNVLSGTVVRYDLVFGSAGLTSYKGVVIASGYAYHTDPNAAVVGPTGLYYDAERDSLMVASTVDNAVYRIDDAGRATTSRGMGQIVYKDDQHLRGPLALVRTPNGNFLVTNGDAINGDKNHPSEIIEFNPRGKFVSSLSLDPGQGGAFGLAVSVWDDMARLVTVNDNTANLLIWNIPLR